jgi:serine/threonine protein kinase
MPLASGTKLGPYEIVSLIGTGGMGKVYKSHDTRLDRTVALKVCNSEFSERFEREARAIAALNHPHICMLHDVGPNYLVMEYIDGTPLKGPLPLDQALEYATQICDALDAAHRKGITHRDLKPANILVTKTGIKLLDFGLAKMARTAKAAGDATLTMAFTGKNEIVGTLYYMSPEQLEAQANGHEVEARSDIFSFGLVLYEMLTGKRAFEGASPASVIAAIIERPVPSIADVAPRALDRILQRCVKKDPEQRWQNARDLMFELASVSESAEAAPAPPKRNSWLRYAVTALLAIAATAAVFRLMPHDAATPTSDWKVSLTPPPGSDLADIGDLAYATPEISPDGSMVVAGIGDHLALRRLNGTEWTPLRGTEQANQVFWSADSQAIGFLDRLLNGS